MEFEGSSSTLPNHSRNFQRRFPASSHTSVSGPVAPAESWDRAAINDASSTYYFIRIEEAIKCSLVSSYSLQAWRHLRQVSQPKMRGGKNLTAPEDSSPFIFSKKLVLEISAFQVMPKVARMSRISMAFNLDSVISSLSRNRILTKVKYTSSRICLISTINLTSLKIVTVHLDCSIRPPDSPRECRFHFDNSIEPSNIRR